MRDAPPTRTDELTRWVLAMRPELHRYCARMLGSTIDGEDAVQDTQIRALDFLRRGRFIERPRQWLFRIAHNASIDRLRARTPDARHEPLPDVLDRTDIASSAGADERVAVRSGFQTFLALPVTERAAVLLKDVLGFRSSEIARTLGAPLSSVTNWIHRGRARLHAMQAEPVAGAPPRANTDLLDAYARLFNDRDWDGLGNLLAEQVRIELVGQDSTSRGTYFGNYARQSGLRMVPGSVDGIPALLMYRAPSSELFNIVLLDGDASGVVLIRDFVHADHVVEALRGSSAAISARSRSHPGSARRRDPASSSARSSGNYPGRT